MIIQSVKVVEPESSVISLGDLDVTMLYIQGCSSDDYSDNHFHTSYEIQYVFDGTLLLETKDNVLTVKAGESVLIPPYVIHRNISEDQHYSRFSMSLFFEHNQKNDKEDFSEYVYYCELFRRIDTVRQLSDEGISHMFERFLSLGTNPEARHRKELYLSMIFTTVSDILKQSMSDGNIHTKGETKQLSLEDRKRGFMIEQYIALNYTDPDLSDGLRKMLYLSRRQTDRIVRSVFGEGICKITEKYKMKTAGLLTSQTDQPLKKIAQDIGYTSYVGFYNAFIRYYGCSPEKYRTISHHL